MRTLVCLMAICTTLTPAETLDRIAVTVGKEVITESALLLYLRITSFLDHNPLEVTPATKRDAAQQLVDQVLMLREARDSHLGLPEDEEAKILLDQVKAPYSSEGEWNAALERSDITERDVLNHLRAGLQALTFTDLRFRPAIHVTDEEAQTYYDRLAAEVAGKPASFEESRAQIEEILAGQRVMEALDEWLKSARESAEIRYRESAFQ